MRYDDVTGTATRASIFTERVVAPRAPRLGANSPADAPAICLDTHSKVRLDEIARLLGTTEEVARAELGELLFDEPDHREVGAGRLVPAAEYLSGKRSDQARGGPRCGVGRPAVARVVLTRRGGLAAVMR